MQQAIWNDSFANFNQKNGRKNILFVIAILDQVIAKLIVVIRILVQKQLIICRFNQNYPLN